MRGILPFRRSTMAGIQLSGLASGFDWVPFVDQMIELERASVTRLEAEQAVNTRRMNAISTLGDKIQALGTATDALNDAGLFAAREAKSSAGGWSVRAGEGATIGDFSFNVQQLARSAKLVGAGDRGAGLAPDADVSGLIVADLPTRVGVTAGSFTVNGAQVEVSLTDTLQEVFDKLAVATDGAVTASYDPAADGIRLTSDEEIVLGAANDTSNFTYALGLFNNGTSSIEGQGNLGTLDIYANLTDARFQENITAVDAEGNGSFTINGVTIDYNTGTDSLNDVMARINASDAGVQASYDAAADRLTLTNSRTGDSGITVSEASGGLLGALGLTSGATLERGQDARFTINNGPTLTSPTNSLDTSAHGIEGLTVTATGTGTSEVTVSTNTSGVRDAIEQFVAKFNDIQDYIEEQTKITSEDGSVSTGTLSSNRQVDSWAREMRSMAFAALDAGTSGIVRLESLGIDFRSGTNKLEVKDSGKLDDAIANNLGEVSKFFTTRETGFAARMDSFVERLVGASGDKGYVERESASLRNANNDIDTQIERLERYLEQRRSQLEASFIAMEQAQQKLNNMQSQLTQAFFTNSSGGNG